MIADPTRAAVVHEARTWIGTPFHHQARVKGAGVDCLGLVWGTGETCAVMPAVSATDAKPFWRFYGRRPNPAVMRECLAKFLVEIPRDQVQPGDMADAIDLAQFYLSEASRLASAALVSAEIDRAEALRVWLVERWHHSEITVRDVVNRGPNPLRYSPPARAALGILQSHGWIVPLDPGTVVRGAARAEAWRIVKGPGDVV